MLKFYKNSVQKYIEFTIKKEKIDIEKMRKDDLLFYVFLDVFLNFCYVLFGIFSIMSLYFFLTIEIFPLFSKA